MDSLKLMQPGLAKFSPTGYHTTGIQRFNLLVEVGCSGGQCFGDNVPTAYFLATSATQLV